MTINNNFKISVIICTLRRPEYLKRCLGSLIVQNFPPHEIIVVYASDDHITEKLLKEYNVISVQQKELKGLSNARNLGINAASGHIIAFIDDDAIADKNWLKHLICGYNDECIGGVGGIVYSPDGKFMNFSNGYVDSSGNVYNDNEIYKNTEKLFPYLIGCNCSFKKEVLLSIGGFNEYYKYMYDETDLCVRIIRKGYKIVYVNNAIVFHAFEGQKDMWFHLSKNRTYFLIKNFNPELPLLKIISRDLSNLYEDVRSNIKFKRRKIYFNNIYHIFLGYCFGISDSYIKNEELLQFEH